MRKYPTGGQNSQPVSKTAILSTGGVLLYLPHHLDLASEDSAVWVKVRVRVRVRVSTLMHVL